MSRWLPREHGAYGQLGVPLAAALASGRPGVAAIAFTLGAIAVFFAHEPLLVLLARRSRETARTARRLEHSLGGELVLASLLAGAAVPVAITSGVDRPVALWAWAAWAIGFGAVTCAIHGAVLGSHRRGRPGDDDPRRARVAGAVLIVVAVIIAALRPVPVAAIAPLALVAVGVHWVRPSPRRLRRVGWTLMTATLVTGVAMVIGVRLAA